MGAVSKTLKTTMSCLKTAMSYERVDVRMRMDPEFWYQQHNFDSNAHHLNNHMINMVQKYMRGNAPQMETYINLGDVVYEFKTAREILPGAN